MTSGFEPLGYWRKADYRLATVVVLAAGLTFLVLQRPARLAVARSTLAGLLALLVLGLVPAWPRANLIASSTPVRQTLRTEIQAKTDDEPDVSCRLLDPDGQPFAGAKVYLASNTFTRNGPTKRSKSATLLGTTGPDGSFRHPQQAGADRLPRALVVATADGYGPAFADPSVQDGGRVLKLVKDDVPIRGRVLDIQGQPVAGATVQVVGVLWHPGGTLDEWLEKLTTEKSAYSVAYSILRSWSNNDVPSFYPPVVADAAGRFTLHGIGRERIAALLISGPGVETRFEYAVTRAMTTIRVPDFARQRISHEIAYHGAVFDLVAGPGLEVTGTVTDADSGKPLAGVTVETAALFGNPLRTLNTVTDDQGHYRLAGIPPRTKFNDEQSLLVSPSDGPPYLPALKPLGKAEGLEPITVDFPLKRGIWAAGRVVEKTDGRGVRANLSYYILEDNPYRKTYPEYGTIRVATPLRTDDDGSFKLVVMPGPGVIGARVGNEHYRLGVGAETIPHEKRDGGGLEMIAARPSYLIPTNYHTVVGINPKEGDDSVTCEIGLDRGKTVQGKIIGPDGHPLAGARVEGLQDHFRIWSHTPLPSDEFLVEGIGPGASRDLLIYHEERNLAGAYLIKVDEGGPITVTLEPCGTVTGRLVDSDGLPLAEVEMIANVPFNDARHESGSLPGPVKTDKDGRFRAAGLVPGRRYTFKVRKGNRLRDAAKDVVIERGETRELGDVIVNTGT